MLLPCPAPAADPRAPLPKAADSTGKRRDALWPLDCSAQARGPGLLARGRKKPVPGPGTGRQGECSRGRDDSASCFGKGRTAGTDNSQAGRMRLLWGCVWGLGSTEPQAWQHRPEPPPAAEQWPPAACAWRPALRPWAPWWFWVRHPQGAWAESVRAGLMFKLASERPRAGQGPGCLSRLPRLPVWPPAGVAGSRSPCHPCPCLCVRRARCHQKGVSRSGGARTSPALPLGPLLWARLWSQQAAGLRDACEESLKRVRGHAAQGWVSPWQKPSASGAASPQAGQAPGPGSCHPTAAPNPGPA